MDEVKWISRLKARWYVGRHGSNFVFVEFKGTYRKGTPVIIRSIQVVGKQGRKQTVHSEIYPLDKAREIVEAEQTIVETLANSVNEDLISMLKIYLIKIENLVSLVKNLVSNIEEVMEYSGKKEIKS